MPDLPQWDGTVTNTGEQLVFINGQRLAASETIGLRPLTSEEYAEAHRELQEVIKPFIKQKMDIISLATPQWLMHADGRIEKVSDGFTQDLRDLYQRLEEMQQETSRAIFAKLARGML